jgi:hypothetical protein
MPALIISLTQNMEQRLSRRLQKATLKFARAFAA